MSARSVKAVATSRAPIAHAATTMGAAVDSRGVVPGLAPPPARSEPSRALAALNGELSRRGPVIWWTRRSSRTDGRISHGDHRTGAAGRTGATTSTVHGKKTYVYVMTSLPLRSDLWSRDWSAHPK